ncbi:MAG: hypothetical protein Q8942_02205 [Bacillota bacterium]|nr:hypothetical protein [Bacillota bacterium]
MKDNKNIKKTVWLYAVVLFTSAFIVLLLTYYSQMKTDKSINDYLNRISNEEKKKLLFQTGLNTATEENKGLKKNIENLNSIIKKEKEKENSIKDDLDNVQKNYLDTMNSYDQLLFADNSYNNGEIVKSADMLNECDINFLNSVGKEKYDYLSSIVFEKAASILYLDGYSLYKSKMYNDAINRFEKSLSFSKHNYISDDCYYFIAYSYINLGDISSGKSKLQDLINNYKDSSYYKDSVQLLKSLN